MSCLETEGGLGSLQRVAVAGAALGCRRVLVLGTAVPAGDCPLQPMAKVPPGSSMCRKLAVLCIVRKCWDVAIGCILFKDNPKQKCTGHVIVRPTYRWCT